MLFSAQDEDRIEKQEAVFLGGENRWKICISQLESFFWGGESHSLGEIRKKKKLFWTKNPLKEIM